MSLRRQLPVYSPLPAGALWTGVRALLGGGPAARRALSQWLEREFAVGRPLLTSSGTAALSLALLAVYRRLGLPVALPAWGCFDLVTSAQGAGVPVRWYDLDPRTLAPHPASVEAAVAAGVSAIVIVHLYGIPVDLRPIRRLAEGAGILLIEDAAQGIGGSIDERPLGALGDLGVLSFGRGKGLTGGGGGALLPNTPAGQEALLALSPQLGAGPGEVRTLAAAMVQCTLARPALYGIPASLPFLRLGETVYREPEAPAGISSAAAGILRATAGLVWAEADRRRANAEWFRSQLGESIRFPGGGIGRSGYLRLPALGEDAPARAAASGAALGIMPGYPKVLNALSLSSDTAERFPGAECLVASLITVPVHGLLGPVDRERIVNWMTVQLRAAPIEKFNDTFV